MNSSDVFRTRYGFLLAALALLAPASAGRAAPFTPGNLVVTRVGTGGGALSSAATAAFLDEYTTTGIFVQSIPLPTALMGGNRQLTLSGTSTSEGHLARSGNGAYLTMAGYDALVGTLLVANTTSAAVNRVVGRIDANGIIDTTTALTDAYSTSNPRSAVSVDGTSFWTGGTGGVSPSPGVHYATLGATTSTQLSTTVTNTRVVNIFNGQLYVSSASGAFLGVSTVGAGTPTTSGQTTTLLPGFPGPGSPSNYDYFFTDPNTLYVADDRTILAGGGLQKWTFNGINWSLMYTLQNGLTAGLRGLTGTTGSPVLFATTGETQTRLVMINDTGPTASFVPLAPALTNTAFRGVDFAPMAGPGGAVPSGNDWFATVPTDANNNPISYQNFGPPESPPIPAGFFGPGCDPFIGTIAFEGVPIDTIMMGLTDTVVRRLQSANLPNVGSTATIPIEIVSLNLVSSNPITVTCPSDPCGERWNVSATLPPFPPQPTGQMTIIKTHPNGGVFQSTLLVQPLLTFTKVRAPSQVVVLDTAAMGLPPIMLSATGVPWVHTVNPSLNVFTTPSNNFVPGVVQSGNTQTKMLTMEQAMQAAHGILPPCPPPPCPPPPPVRCWNDYSCGTWTNNPLVLSADFDGDGDVDLADHSIYRAAMGGPNNILLALPDDFWNQLLGAPDVDGNSVSDLTDWSVLQNQFTGSLAPTQFRVMGDGQGETLQHDSRLSYTLDENRFMLNGRLDDPDVPGLEWDFQDYGAPYSEFFNRETLTDPGTLNDPGVQERLMAHEFTPQDIAAMQTLAGPNRVVTQVIDAAVDLTHNTTGSLIVRWNKVPRPDIPTLGLTQGGIQCGIVLTSDGGSFSWYRWIQCPGCFVRIIKCPICVCNGCTYTFRAVGLWPGGTYVWEVLGPVPAVPPGGAGPIFTTMFNGRSQAKKDVIVKVTYTAPGGLMCMNICRTTAVTLNVTFDPRPSLNTLPCAGANMGTPMAGGGSFTFGMGAQVGINGTVKNIRIHATLANGMECEECCKNTKIGFIQNLLATTRTSTYAGGGPVMVDTTGCGALPLLDTSSAGAAAGSPFYPFAPPGQVSMRCGVACNTPFNLGVTDWPGGASALCRQNMPPAGPIKMLTRFQQDDRFRLFLVAECPKNCRVFKCLHQWDWQAQHDVNGIVTNANCLTAMLPAMFTACSDTTYNGPCVMADFAAIKTSGAIPNNCVMFTRTPP